MPTIVPIASMKFELEKFTGRNNFNLWRIKISTLLETQSLDLAFEGDNKFHQGMKGEEKADI